MDAPAKNPWSILLDNIAVGILNWRSTLRGLLRLSVVVSGVLTALDKNTSGEKYAGLVFGITVGAEAVRSWLDQDSGRSNDNSN